MPHRHAALITLCLLFAGPASADTRLTVTVYDRTPSGPRLGDAVVCLDGVSPTRTDGSGTAVFPSVPAGARVLSVWKDGYQVVRQQLLFNERTAGAVNQIILLPPGAGTAPCSPPSAAVSSTPVSIDARTLIPLRPDTTPTIASVTLNRGAQTVDVNEVVQVFVTVTGPAPTEVRMSETSAQFPEGTAGWRPYAPSPAGYIYYPGTVFQKKQANKTVYVQVRAGANLSNVATDTITLVGPRMIPMRDVYTEAKSQGFSFVATPKGALDLCVVNIDGSLSAGTLLRPGGCSFTMFGGRQLKAGWTANYTATVPAPCAGSVRRTPSGANLEFQLETSALPLAGCIAFLSDVRLYGPVDGLWQQAFTR